MSLSRYAVSLHAGSRRIRGRVHPYAVIDRRTGERVRWFRSFGPAMAYVERMNRAVGTEPKGR